MTHPIRQHQQTLGLDVVREEKGETLRYQDLAVEIDGYDPRSGATTWSVTATPRYARRMLDDDGLPLVAGGVSVETASGPVAVDLRDGTMREPSGNRVADA